MIKNNKILKMIMAMTVITSTFAPTVVAHAVTEPSNQTTQVVGTFEALTLDVSIPASSSFLYNPNTGQMTAQQMDIKNNSNAPIYVKSTQIAVASNSDWRPTLVAPTTYNDVQWKNLTKSQTNKSVALGLVATESESWLSGIESNNFWSTNIDTGIKVGAIKANSAVAVQPSLKAGTAIDTKTVLNSNYVFEFGIEQ